MENDNKFISAELAAAINDLLDKGLTVEEIADQLEIPVVIVSAQSIIYQPPGSKRAMLELQLVSLVPLLEIAKLKYRSDPRQGSSTALSQLTSQMQSLIKQLNETETPEELYRELLTIFQSLVTELIAALTRDARDMRNALERAGMSDTVADHQVNNMLRSFGIQAKDAYDKAAQKMAKVIEYDDEGNQGAPPGVIPLPQVNDG